MVFLMFAVTLAMNLDDNLLARLGVGENFALVMVLSALITMIMAGRNIYIIAIAVLLCLLANMPVDFSLNFGVDRDYYAGVMLALIIQPLIARVLD